MGNGRDKSMHAFDKYTGMKAAWIDLGIEPGTMPWPSSAGVSCSAHRDDHEDAAMAKGLDKKKEQKKKPAKTLKEKRAEKSGKKAARQ
jgi:hypothetical protein